MRKSFFLFVVGALMCFVNFSSVRAEENPDSSIVGGWGITFGVLLFPQPNFNYEATSIGDIKFPCRTYGGSFSVFALTTGSTFGRKHLSQAELGMSWLVEKGHKNLTLQGYPAIAESDLQQIGIGFCFKLYYLRIGKIWLSSGFEVYCGWNRDLFNISLFRDDRKIDVFDPETRTHFGANGGIVLLSVAILDNNLNSWDLLFGYGGSDTSRDNAYKRYSSEDGFPDAGVDGWYFHIRKLIFFDLRKQKSTDTEDKKIEETTP
jgi:hypothetical protein